MNKITIRASQQGWVVYFDSNPENFYPFRSNEGDRLVKFFCEKIVGVKMDSILDKRRDEIAEASKRYEEQGHVNS